MIEQSAFRFLGYKIPKIEMIIDDNFGVAPKEEIENSTKIGFALNPESPKFVEVLMTIILKAKSNTFSFHLEIKGGFLGDDSMTDEGFKNLYTKNAPAVLYPFARAIVSNYMVLANIPAFNLPLVNLSNNEEAEKLKDQ